MAPPGALPPPTPTILTLKQDFLTAQTRLLAQPLQPSRAWRRANTNNESAGGDENERLTERAVDDALQRLNHTLQQHARRVYPPQATRHVAEQIDGLYLAAGDARHRAEGEGEGENGEGGEDVWRMQGADYANPEIIASLPPTWDSTQQAPEARRYADLVTRLQDLSFHRAEAEARVRRLRKVRALLRPFDASENEQGEGETNGGGGGGGIQDNLVTRGGEVERELERMRMLLARVGDKVARLEGHGGAVDSSEDDLFGDGDAMVVDDVEVVERRKVEGLLHGLT
ncbi:hypothetical protein M406DRAFT_358330 [Cryphonectria parasitica EP155]|uniref:Kinetochore protein n=1 Tax=Cryphonectria parasitica (strain ATCC 38755 / EP155) TaxID=660469 RepID=A0A9P4XTT3_CRYP1|nr:uncharacterized protein M406DRAFT_358330 [Cryphonectria parasitica EP155]KAF3760756.1 hypothetical protein M406DRAFT_358330 [Cryphonectria parasitica EP155]